MHEKRRFPRFTVEGLHGTMVFASTVEVINMSLGGAAIQADRRLNIGGDYTLKLDTKDHCTQVRGTVVWSVLSGIRKGANGEDIPQYSAGLKFNDVLTERIRELMEFIDENKLVKEYRLSGLRFHIDAPGKAILEYPHGYKVRILSLSGMLIETDQSFEVGETYPLEIELPDPPPIRAVGRVASHSEIIDETPMHYEIGIEFVDLSEEEKTRLQRYVEERV